MTDAMQLCTFWVNDLLFGIEAHRVQEVLKGQCITPVPLAAAAVRGLINLRGQIATVLDVKHKLGLKTEDESSDAHANLMHVVVQTDEGLVSLQVDDIGDIVELTQSSFEPVPETVPQDAKLLLTGVHKLDRGLLLVLNTETLFQSMADGANE